MALDQNWPVWKQSLEAMWFTCNVLHVSFMWKIIVGNVAHLFTSLNLQDLGNKVQDLANKKLEIEQLTLATCTALFSIFACLLSFCAIFAWVNEIKNCFDCFQSFLFSFDARCVSGFECIQRACHFYRILNAFFSNKSQVELPMNFTVHKEMKLKSEQEHLKDERQKNLTLVPFLHLVKVMVANFWLHVCFNFSLRKAIWMNWSNSFRNLAHLDCMYSMLKKLHFKFLTWRIHQLVLISK